MKPLKFITLLLCSIIISFSCSKEQDKDYIIITGGIKNHDTNTILVTNNHGYRHSIEVNSDGSFTDTLFCLKGFYKLEYTKNKTINLYLNKGYHLKLYLNPSSKYKTIFSGKGSSENEYLSKKQLLKENIGFKSSVIKNISETNYMIFCDSIFNLKQNLLFSYEKQLEFDFVSIEKKDLEADNIDWIHSFVGLKKYYNPKFKLSKDYPNPYLNASSLVNVENKDLILSDNYCAFLKKYFNLKTKLLLKKTNDNNFHSTYWRITKKEIKSPYIFEELNYQNGLSWLKTTINMDTTYKLLKSNFKSPYYLKKIEETYFTYKKMETGTPAPNFELKDVTGNTVNLNDLKGKLIYIDFWGTYCKPCFNLMPALHKVEKHFEGKDIHFVGIGMDGTDTLWKKRMEQFDMAGIQLRSASREHPFLKYFNVIGIPRFMLLDRQGRIIDAIAKQPDNPKLITQIEELL